MLGFGCRTWKQNDGQGWRFICWRYGDIVWRLASGPTSGEQYSVTACLLLQRLTNNSNTAIFLSDYLRPQTEIHSFILKCDKRASMKTLRPREKRGKYRKLTCSDGMSAASLAEQRSGAKGLWRMGRHLPNIVAPGKFAKGRSKSRICYAIHVWEEACESWHKPHDIS